MYQEIELTIMNTEELYNLAKDVTDINLDNNQISNLTSATLRQISKNTGEPQFLATKDLKEMVRAVVIDVKMPEYK